MISIFETFVIGNVDNRLVYYFIIFYHRTVEFSMRIHFTNAFKTFQLVVLSIPIVKSALGILIVDFEAVYNEKFSITHGYGD